MIDYYVGSLQTPHPLPSFFIAPLKVIELIKCLWEKAEAQVTSQLTSEWYWASVGHQGSRTILWPTYSLYPSIHYWDLADPELLGILLHDSCQPAITCSVRDSYERLSNPHTSESCSSSAPSVWEWSPLWSSSASGLLVHAEGLPKTMGVPPSLHLGLEPPLLTSVQECGLNTVSTPPTSSLWKSGMFRRKWEPCVSDSFTCSSSKCSFVRVLWCPRSLWSPFMGLLTTLPLSS